MIKETVSDRDRRYETANQLLYLIDSIGNRASNFPCLNDNRESYNKVVGSRIGSGLWMKRRRQWFRTAVNSTNPSLVTVIVLLKRS